MLNKNFRSFLKIFAFMKPHMRLYIPGLILYSSQRFIFPFISALLVSRLTAAMLEADAGGVFRSAAVFFGLYGTVLLAVAVGTYFYATSSAKAVQELKRQLFKRFVTANIEDAMAGHSGEGIAALNTDANKASDLFSNALSPFLSQLIAISFSALTVFLIDYRLGFASLGLGALALLAQSRFAGPLAALSAKQLAALSNSTRAASNIFSGGLAIRAFNLQDKAFADFDAENLRIKSLSFAEAGLSMWRKLFGSLQGWLTLCAVYALGGWLVATKRLDFPALMMAPLMCMAVAESMSNIGAAWAALQAPAVAAERVLKLLGEPGAYSQKLAANAEERASRPAGGMLSVKNLSFKYKNTEDYVLKDINLEIKQNEMVAFVGASGSGKSTLLRTVIGLYEREGLDISLGATALASCGTAGWRRLFAYVDQSCKLFDMSIAENIALGAGGGVHEEKIRAFAARAFADEFISALPEGYGTPCGEKGAALSGGQKQRIAIARALCREAPVLVFDEAASALDGTAERHIMAAIEQLRKDHTVLITAHNLRSITGADKIVVMDGGRVAELGTHAELMEREGLYAALYNRTI